MMRFRMSLALFLAAVGLCVLASAAPAAAITYAPIDQPGPRLGS